MSICKLTVVKMGVIGSSLILDILMDERASRKDVQVRTVSSGVKMTPDVVDIVDRALEFETDVFLLISPVAHLEGPTEARKKLLTTGKPVIVVTDDGGKKIIEFAEKENFGYIIVNLDPMIGARKQYLDPTEMVLFNGLLLTSFACIGVVARFQKILDDIIEQVKSGGLKELPRIEINPDDAVEAGNFSNPYAKAKARAAAEILKRIPTLTRRCTWKEKDPSVAAYLCAAAHELLKLASDTAQVAREIEKGNDTVVRLIHERDGRVTIKKGLLEPL